MTQEGFPEQERELWDLGWLQGLIQHWDTSSMGTHPALGWILHSTSSNSPAPGLLAELAQHTQSLFPNVPGTSPLFFACSPHLSLTHCLQSNALSLGIS